MAVTIPKGDERVAAMRAVHSVLIIGRILGIPIQCPAMRRRSGRFFGSLRFQPTNPYICGNVRIHKDGGLTPAFRSTCHCPVLQPEPRPPGGVRAILTEPRLQLLWEGIGTIPRVRQHRLPRFIRPRSRERSMGWSKTLNRTLGAGSGRRIGDLGRVRG